MSTKKIDLSKLVPCIAGINKFGICDAAAYCDREFDCCTQCDDDSCFCRCRWLTGVAETQQNPKKRCDFAAKPLPLMKNNEQRRKWLRNYKDWGIWYEDKHIGARYYKYDFENGARLIAEEYTSPADGPVPEHEISYLHLVGGPEPKRRSGIPKWAYNKVYNRYPDSEGQLMEFLKEVQRNGQID